MIHHMSDDDIAKKGYNLISHYKFHIIPRFENDGVEMKWARQDLDLRARAGIASEIRQHLGVTLDERAFPRQRHTEPA
jgi:diadenosine tetraphosphate (Ap4A) HIT family hydrolase